MSHHHHHHTHTNAPSKLVLASVLNLGFSILEFICGTLFNSTAILSDAIHDLGDALVLGFSVLIEKASHKKPTLHFSYGYRRLSLIGALVNIFVLTIGLFYIFSEAIERFFNPEPVNSLGMFLISIVGIGINLAATLQLKGSKNILDKSVFAHLLEDVLGWVAVFVTSIIIFFTGWSILDPIISLFIGLVILKNILDNLKESFTIIMQATPRNLPLEEIHQKLMDLPFVEKMDHLHIWSLDGQHHVLSAHLKVKGTDFQVYKEILVDLLEPYAIVNTTIEWH